MSKSKTNKSALIRELHDKGKTIKEIVARVKCSESLARVVISNYKNKTSKKKPSKIVEASQITKAELDALLPKPQEQITVNFARRKDGAIIDLDRGGEVISAPDLVNKPPHYTTGGVDFLDFAEAKNLTENAYLFNVVKYVTRCGKKEGVDPVQDLQKARFYLDREINRRKEA